MVECEVSRIIIDEKSHEQVVVLREKGGERFLPIVIGIAEASSIRIKFGGPQPPRPITHDLIKTIIEALDARLDGIVVDDFKDNTFFAKMLLKTADGRNRKIDARPSDSIAVAVRMGAPIFVEEDVLEHSSYPQT
jgi:bifunctional DNase/RNase